MNLVLAFIQNEDADQVTRALLDADHRVTRINTAGAFLRRGNVTLLIGVEEAKVDEVVDLIKDSTGISKPGLTDQHRHAGLRRHDLRVGRVAHGEGLTRQHAHSNTIRALCIMQSALLC